MRPNPQLPDDLVILTEKILNGKLHIFCGDNGPQQQNLIHNDPHKLRNKICAIHKNQTNNSN